MNGHEVFTAYVPNPRGPVFMTMIEKTFGANITTRTWDTVKKCATGQLTGVASCNPAQPRRVPCSWISTPQGGLGLTVLVLPVSRRATATALSIDAILSAPVC